MAIVETHPEHIDGPWIDGFVLVYQMKYRNGSLEDTVETAVAFVTERWGGRRC